MSGRPSVGSLFLASILVFGSCSSEPWPAPRPELVAVAPPEPVAEVAVVEAPSAEPPVARVADSPTSDFPPKEPERSPVEEPAPEPGATSEEPPAPLPPPSVPLELFAVGREVFVLAAPNAKARKLGYLRAGARVLRSAEPVSFAGCPGGFYRVAPEGFVCAGEGARLRPGPVHQLVGAPADRFAPLPFVYARVTGAPPFYTKLPSAREQRELEPEVSPARAAKQFLDLPALEVPSWLAAGKTTPTPFGHARDASSVVTGRALPDGSFAVLGIFDHGGRRFGLVNDLTLVPLDRTERVTGSNFHGLSLDGQTLPVAFVMRRGVEAFTGDAKSGLRIARTLAFREALPLAGEPLTIGGLRFVRTVSGELVRDDRLLVVEPLSELPRWAKGGRRWIRVSITSQSLVAYEGERPVYVTLVSTGVDGLGDPVTSRSTVRGQFLIHTKHVTAAMTSAESGDEYDLRDVPWVQYFSDNYAFHAAYWHDAFGTARSHGCINLSPRDARFLFHWTDPPVPQGWHGAFSLREGTLVDIVP